MFLDNLTGDLSLNGDKFGGPPSDSFAAAPEEKVQVFLRVRPLLASERNERICTYQTDQQTILLSFPDNLVDAGREFSYKKVFAPTQ